ncbi:Outer membrane protein-like protein (plasmid) [Novosphingobium aromaticivorans DSM 12444]|uniref:Outer membrane protein-like protein n=1 Tax=Novosphingobium aromaticivorans (strain ATCC 700278 / DSM 12444 / CCUG 56034 / CIP 105152 / NBRC 16084 / F199) TaxID=279238 RepID=A4XFD5_NOVAD|nr:TolC family protein [Novosphingobium aromaticivorans]ABP64646.1 Outer membrane protein-like protein [Novosphingobium aromaticivorans DSM 12444]SCY91889.1 Outer membrane protein TolC [Novosphingobium aromaticivorans]
MRGILAALLALLGASLQPARAADLTLQEVLDSSALHAPQILEAMARQRQADARALTAEGQFDLVFDADAQARPLGYYDGSLADLRATRPLQTNGGNLYAGYRLSTGAFPTYEGKSITNELGEVRVGAIFSLLRDRLIDERRGRRELAESDVEIAALDREMVAIGVQRRAVEAYQQWVAAGLRVRAFRELYELAEQRQSSIERQIELGARPAILGVENRQNIVRRNALLVRAEQDLQLQANALSLFLRDPLGRPLVPAADRLPTRMPETLVPRLVDTANAIAGRPDLRALLARIEQNGIRTRMAENELRPRLDLRVEASKDIGRGSPVREPVEGMFGLRFSVPLEQRAAKGRIAEVAAEQDALSLRLRLLEEQVGVEIANLRTQMDGAGRLAALATDEAALARRMAEAERRRFSLGASDFLVVNLREEALADATVREIDAHYRHAAATAELVAAQADREQLRL